MGYPQTAQYSDESDKRYNIDVLDIISESPIRITKKNPIDGIIQKTMLKDIFVIIKNFQIDFWMKKNKLNAALKIRIYVYKDRFYKTYVDDWKVIKHFGLGGHR